MRWCPCFPDPAGGGLSETAGALTPSARGCSLFQLKYHPSSLKGKKLADAQAD